MPGPLTFFVLETTSPVFFADDEQEPGDYGYEQTVFGHYNTDLQNQAAEVVRQAKLKNRRRAKKEVSTMRVLDLDY